MPSNFLSSPFSDWVRKQVNVRQESLGKYSNIPTKDLQHYITKTPFLRVASSVNLTRGEGGTGGKSVLNDLIRKGYLESEIGGNLLARNFILQGGVVSVKGDFADGEIDVNSEFSGLNSGLNNGSSIFNGAYGWGGIEERGYVPMPGITQADVTYYNNGALSKTVINVKCFSKEQFQLFDVLYLRPGYTLLMEFGWSQYLNNSKELINFDQFLTEPMSMLLGSTKYNQYNLWDSIDRTKELHVGNYDAVFGKISNFNWTFNPDGSYDCTIELTAVGDVISSLKCDITTPEQVLVTGESWFEKFYQNQVKENAVPPLIANAQATTINKELYSIFQRSEELTSQIPSLADYTVKKVKDGRKTPTDVTYSGSILVVPGSTLDNSREGDPQTFIKYGAFLSFIQSHILLYDDGIPLFRFDIDFDDIDKDDNVILYIPGQLSADPRVCLIPYNSSNIDDTFPAAVPAYVDYPLNTLLKTTSYQYGDYLARFTNIMVSTNYIAEALEETIAEDGNIPLIDFLNYINSGIIKATGGINDFKFKLSDNGGLVRLMEDTIPQRRSGIISSNITQNSTPEYTRFNVFGVKPGVEGSFIRNINLNGTISSDFSTMISIGAQSNANQISENATSFSNYNAGLIDRIIPKKLSEPSDDSTTTTTNSSIEETIKTIWNNDSGDNYLENTMKSIYGPKEDKGLKWVNVTLNAFVDNNKTNAGLMLGVLSDINTKDKQDQKAQQLQSPFFLPFKLTLEMDGLSGMKLYQKFLMTDDILPSSYQDDAVDLQLTGINHSITPASWITKLETLSVPAEGGDGAVKRPQQSKSKATTQSATGTTTPLPATVNIPIPPPVNPLSPTRREAMLASYAGVFNRDGEKAAMCARWTANMALGYAKIIKGNTLPSKQISAGGNANNNNEYYNNLTALGYKKTASTGITMSELRSKLSTTTWGYGDVVAYWANDAPTSGKNTHHIYGHTQIYVGDINSSGWSSSYKENYNTSFPYGKRKSINWNLIVFRAPS